ncbi:iron chelate uptake ABC transporter family permease subunit [Spirillospora sp. NPDC029432]|uniref:FecCD family ABC transporter permease n=1 Tax=Spirillospora sp. NPDC029432 TaxID=3154599 RepID=UPI0034527654
MTPGPEIPATAVRAVARARTRGTARARAVCALLVPAGLAMFLLSLSVGDYAIPLPDLAASLTARGTPAIDYVVHRLRLPRAELAVLVGAAFGLSGAIFQKVVRNPLASPDIIGITAGASTGAVALIVLAGASGLALSAGALGGALLTSALIYLLAWRQGVTGYRLALVGIGVASALTGVVSYLLTRTEVKVAQEGLVWLTGSLYGRADRVLPLAVAMAVLVPAAFALGRTLRALQLGDDAARGLGLDAERTRLALLAVGTGLAGAATAAAGPVAFVAFLSGPIAARLTRGGGLGLLPAALVGVLITLVADFAAQHMLGGTQLTVGVVTGAVGAPYLLWLLAVSNRGGYGG